MVPNTSLLGTQHKGLVWGVHAREPPRALCMGYGAQSSSSFRLLNRSTCAACLPPISLPLSCQSTAVLSIKAKSPPKKISIKHEHLFLFVLWPMTSSYLCPLPNLVEYPCCMRMQADTRFAQISLDTSFMTVCMPLGDNPIANTGYCSTVTHQG